MLRIISGPAFVGAWQQIQIRFGQFVLVEDNGRGLGPIPVLAENRVFKAVEHALAALTKVEQEQSVR